MELVQVGDQLGDRYCNIFAQEMAHRLVTTKWRNHLTTHEPLQSTIMSLHNNLKALIFEKFCAFEPAHVFLEEVLPHWPMPMQQVRFSTNFVRFRVRHLPCA